MFHDDNIVLDRFAQGIIRRKARILVGRAGFTAEDREALQQELILRLLQAIPRYDPARAHPNVFVTTVIERAVARILRDQRAKKRTSGKVLSLDQERDTDSDDPGIEPADPRIRDQEAVDLAYDLAEVLARLPDDLRDLADRLKNRTVSEVARDLGVARSTLQRRVSRLRRIFEDAGLRVYL